MPFVIGPIGVDHGNFHAIDEADRIDPDLAVVIPVVLALDRRPLEDARGIPERDPMMPNVATVLGGVLGEAHRWIFTECIDNCKRPRDKRQGNRTWNFLDSQIESGASISCRQSPIRTSRGWFLTRKCHRSPPN